MRESNLSAAGAVAAERAYRQEKHVRGLARSPNFSQSRPSGYPESHNRGLNCC